LQQLELSLPQIENCSDLIAQVARSAKGHASLKNLALINSDELDEHAAAAIADMMTDVPALQGLNLGGCNMGDDAARRLSNGLSSKGCTFAQLDLSDNQIGDTGASALAAALSENSVLERFTFEGNDMGEAGARAMATTLGMNTSLKEINIEYNEIGNGAVHIAQALMSNRTLESINMDCPDESLDAFATCLPHMSGLKALSLRTVDNFTAEHGRAFCKAISRNTVLKEFYLCERNFFSPDFVPNPHIVETRIQVNHLLTLNRGGRSILSSEREVPHSLWPRVLALSTQEPDVIYFFLKEKPDVFFKRTALGKRKRDRTNCVIS